MQTTFENNRELKCCYCNKQTLKKLTKEDFKDSYKLKKGYYDKNQQYWKCENCGKIVISIKDFYIVNNSGVTSHIFPGIRINYKK